MTFRVQRLAEPLELRQRVIHPGWYAFLITMLVIGGFCFFVVFGQQLYWQGQRSAGTQIVPQPTQTNQPAPQPAPPQVQQPTDPTDGMSAAEKARYNKWVNRQ